LKEHGYRTGICGKLHVEPESSFPWDFDERKSHGKMRDPSVAPALARRFLQEKDDRPFFLMINCPDPHAQRAPDNPNAWSFPDQAAGEPARPLAPGPETIWDFQGVDTPLQRQRVAGYLNCVQRFDTIVGRVMEELKQAGREADTIVILIGDHGPPFERGKTTCYESGLRIPFLVRWPGVTRPSVSKALVSTADIAPTIFDAAGVKSPVRMDGRSLRPVLRGEMKGWREYLGAEFHYHGANVFFPRRALRDQRWKIIHNIRAGQVKPPLGIDGDGGLKGSQEAKYEGTPVRAVFERFADPPEWEFFDLSKDPVEFYNLAGKPEVRKEEERLKAALLAWRKETQDPFLDRAFLDRVSKEGAPITRNRKAGA
jgi:N-sulfoglucosamine sulfohydrolase